MNPDENQNPAVAPADDQTVAPAPEATEEAVVTEDAVITEEAPASGEAAA